MKDKDKTREQLISELKEMRQRIAELDALIAERKQVGKALQKSEQRYRLLTDNATDVIWTVGLDMRPTYMSPSIVRLLGYSVEEAMVKTMKEVFTPASYEVAMKAFAEELAIEKMEHKDLSRSRMLEFELKRKDGSIVPVEIGYSFLRGADAQPIEILAIVRDITERKRAEEQLETSKAQMQAILDGSPDGIRQVDTNLKILWANQATLHRNPEVLGQTCYKAMVNKDKPCEGCPSLHAMQTGKIERNVIYQPASRGVSGECYWEGIGVPLKDDEGKIVGAIQITRDVTERKRAEEQLRIKDNAIASSTSAIAIADLEGNLTYVNHAFLKMWGYDDEKEILGRNAVEFWQVAEEAVEVMQATMGRGGWVGELSAKKKDGSIFDVLLSASVVRDEAGKPICRLGSFTDITEHKQAEEALREEKERAEEYLNIAGVMLAMLDADERITLINKRGCEILGYKKEELIGQNWYNILVPEKAREDRRRNQHRLMAGDIGPVQHWERSLLTKNGEERLIAFSVTVVRDLNSQIVGVLLSGEDITEHRRAEEALRESETKLKTILENTRDVVFQLSPLGKIQYVSPKVEEMYGYKPEDLIGKHLKKTTPVSEVPKALKVLKSVLSGKVINNFEINQVDANGKIIPVEINATPVRKGGKIIAAQGVMRDTTDRKRSENKLQKLFTLEKERRLKLETEEKERLQFLNALAHELKTPLTAIVASAGLLIEEIDDKAGSPRVRLTENIIRAIEKLEARLTELLDMARIGIRGFKLDLELLDPLPLVQNVVSELLPVAVERRQALTLIEPKAIPMIWVDKQRFEQVLVNLVTNAIKFTWEGDSIEVRVKQTGSELVVEVEDHGPGITREEQKRIFQPYYRIEADRQRFSGLGLGLALSKQLVELHGGRLWVRSKPGISCIFAFSIPMKKRGKTD